MQKFPKLLVGFETRDDAAVYDLGNGNALISTTDFFMPVVDDPVDFGRIAACNAISDVYAMGGTPLMAISILGWPVDKLPPSAAAKVVDGARDVCNETGIPLAGGHSIDSPEPIFGLAVTGIVKKKNLKKNSTAIPGCRLYLTKPLGIGILTTALKKRVLSKKDKRITIEIMTGLNRAGEWMSEMSYVKALTDVTGFGLLGHLLEMCEGSHVRAEIYRENIPVIEGIEKYIAADCIPGGTWRNWKSYGKKISTLSETAKKILCDPQTSGGLLVAIDEKFSGTFEWLYEKKMHLTLHCIGTLVKPGSGPVITVK